MKKISVLTGFIILVMGVFDYAQARAIRVPADFSTIQAAINVAKDGDEIIVLEGTYFENISFGEKNIVLRSTDPTNPDVVAKTIIDGNKKGSVVTLVTFSIPETFECVLSGFTITNGKAENGGGIQGGWTRVTIENNTVTSNSAVSGGGLSWCMGIIRHNTVSNNSAQKYGGGFYYCSSNINNTIIENNVITNNSAGEFGGGLGYCGGIIQNNTITSNSAQCGGGLVMCGGIIQNNIISKNVGYYNSGGGLGYCSGTIQNNIIIENSSGYGAGLFSCNGTIQNNTIVANSTIPGYTGYGAGLVGCSGTIQNNIIWGNSAIQRNDSCSTPSYSCIQDWTGEGEGNISSDPKFVDQESGDFHLKPDSPCIDAGCRVDGLSRDFENDPRPFGSGFDIGADEYIAKKTAIKPSVWILYQ